MNVSILAARQPRAQRTRERLLEALETLLKSRAFELISVGEIAALAAVSVGSVYAHFKDKDAFLETLLQRHHAKLKRLVETAPACEPAPDLRRAIAAMVRSAMEQSDADAHLSRALAAYLRAAPDAEIDATIEISEAGCRQIEIYLSHYAREISAMSLAEAASLTHWFLNSVFYRRVISARPFMPESRALSDEQIAAVVTTMLTAALTANPIKG